MKMNHRPALTLVFATLLPLGLQARTFESWPQAAAHLQQSLKNQVVRLSNAASISNPTGSSNSAIPIRKASARIRVMKSVFTELPGGSYSFDQTVVCTKTVPINVFDGRQDPVNIPVQDSVAATCPATFKGKPIEVTVVSLLMLQNAIAYETPEDFKVAITSLYSNTGSSDVPYIGAVAATGDLSNHSLLTQASPSIDVDCKTDSHGQTHCRSKLSEFFEATVEAQD